MSENDFELLEKTYGKLIYYAAHRMSGDPAHSFEDKVNSIWGAVLHYLDKYMKQEGINSVEQFISERDNWVKQWIFTQKNNFGKIAKAYSKVVHLYDANGNGDSDNEPLEFSNTFEGKCNYFSEVEFDDLLNSLPKNCVGDMCFTLLTDPKAYMSKGQINYLYLSTKFKKPSKWVKMSVKDALNYLRKNYETDCS